MRLKNKCAATALAGSAVALFGAATPAFAAITQPATSGSPATYTIPVDSSDNALPFTITANGFAANQAGVVPEICDGTPSTAHGWSPGLDCDNQTSPTPRPADSTGSITFSATNSNQQIVDFNGDSPNGLFNCISTDEVPSDATAGPLAGEYQLSQNDSQVTNAAGQTITLNPGYPAWTNCQLRVSSNDAIATADQQFITLTIAASQSQGQAPEAPIAVLLPLGAVGLLAGGVVLARRRRNANVAA